MRRPIQIRRGTAAEWAAANPILRPGELGLETDTGRIKAAPGRAGVAWNSIRGYVNRSESRNRYAAKSLGGSSGTGAFAKFTWDPGQDVTVSFVCASAVAPSGACRLFGSSSANCFNLRVQSNGDLEFLVEATVVATATGGVVFNGTPNAVSCRVTGTTVALSINGVLSASAAFAEKTWATASNFIGGSADSSGQRFPGAIWNLEGTDHGTAANGFTFLLDEPPTSATFVNTLSGTSVGNATKNTGLAYPWVASVVSMDGRGMPFQGVGPLVYSGYVNALSLAADNYVNTLTEVLDPTTSFNATTGIWTAPCAGVVNASWIGSVRASAFTVGDIVRMGIAKNGTAAIASQVYISALDTPLGLNAQRAVSVVAGDTIGFFFYDINANTYSLIGECCVIFTPTPTTG